MPNPERSYWDRVRTKFSNPYETLNSVQISRSRLLFNYDLVAGQHPGMHVMPVLKANAYGHGLLQVAEILQERSFPYLIVDGYFEALRLRRLTKRPMLVMGYIDPANYAKIQTEGLAFVVHDHSTLTALADLRRQIRIHLEINTGMNRYGIEPAELDSFMGILKANPQIRLEGVMSHLADADGETEDYTLDQVNKFDDCIDKIKAAEFDPKLIHIAQTAGSVRAESRHANAIRLGVGLYGINPFTAGTPEHRQLDGLKPALRLTSTITKLIDLRPGERVSYNGIYTVKAATTIGILPLGYYEGVPRSLSNVGQVRWNEQTLPIVGRVCMNHTMIETCGTGAKYMDQVTVISNDPEHANSIAGLHREHGLFSYELLVGLSESMRRVIVE